MEMKKCGEDGYTACVRFEVKSCVGKRSVVASGIFRGGM